MQRLRRVQPAADSVSCLEDEDLDAANAVVLAMVGWVDGSETLTSLEKKSQLVVRNAASRRF